MFTLPLLVALNTFVSAIVLFESLCVMNKMSSQTPHKLRIAYLLLSIGAVHTPLRCDSSLSPDEFVNCLFVVYSST